jgi:ABC-type proline/glycine betaine transport system ATPase subunit
MITKEFIEAFFHNKSSIEDRFVGFNFLYNETKELKEYETTKFDETTIRWIKEKEADLRSRITYLTETKSLENYDNINENIAVINQLLESQFIKKSWLNTVRKVQESYCQYLNEMKYNKHY